MDLDELVFLRMAHELARRSPDPSTQNGAVVVWEDYTVIGQGCNEFPRGVEVTGTRLVRPQKYLYMEHAERNAIYDGGDCTGCTMYALWAACADCARAIIQSGIKKVVTHTFYEEGNDRWDESIAVAREMLEEAGVEYVALEGDINPDVPLLFSGEQVRF